MDLRRPKPVEREGLRLLPPSAVGGLSSSLSGSSCVVASSSLVGALSWMRRSNCGSLT